MDIDELLCLEEEQAYEAQYAEEMSMLNEIQGDGFGESNKPTASCQKQLFSGQSGSDEAACSSRKRAFDEDDFADDLFIDEDAFPASPIPKAKKSKLASSMPTTLDADRDALFDRKQARRDVLGSPAMIEKIINYRDKRVNCCKKLLEDDEIVNKSSSRPLELTKVLVFPPVHSDFVSSTSSDGQRCYMRLRSKEKMLCDSNAISNAAKSSGLLPKSVSEMRQEVIALKERATLTESQSITMGNLRAENIAPETEAMCDDMEDGQDILGDTNLVKGELWVDKFAPTQYTHLLSEESVNRSLLRWLKKWDHVVFGRETPPIEAHKAKTETTGFKTKEQFVRELEDRLDEYKRPYWKVALLSGPPGLGKTTLAHIIARHAGYHVVEMNASDDRSAEIFKSRLDETTQMKSVLEQDKRPNCLVIDEIDGAPQAAINVLIGVVNQVKEGKGRAKKVKKGRNGILQRPIICICNDLYVPSLRQLRQRSFVVHFPPTRSARLASRLLQLCRIQKLQSDMTTLLKLCEKTDNDIRSCVNTLQFVKSSKDKLSSEIVRGLELGQKDQHKSIFYVWHEIFQLPKCKRTMEKNAGAAQLSSDISSQKVGSMSARAYTVHSLVSANGDYEKTFQGVYENYLNMRFKDHNMAFVNKAQEWVQFFDLLSETVHHLQEWSVMPYYPYMFVSFHMMFACVNVPRIAFPTQKFENTKKLQKSEHLLESMHAGMAPAACCFVSRSCAVLDVIPYVLAIMSPTIRPVSSQLYSPSEKQVLQQLVATMLCYNLTYRQERNEEGQYNYVLEPNMAEVCQFEGCPEKNLLSYSTKQMLSKEVEMERMRRNDPATDDNKGGTKPNKKTEKKAETLSSQTSTKNHLQSLENSISRLGLPKEKPVVDFFRRFKAKKVVLKQAVSTKEKTCIIDPGIGNSPVWYKFNEGFSNAVRQTVYVKDFL